MDKNIIIAQSLGIQNHQVKNTIQLLEEGATIPFIARYRKELTDGLDEVEIENIKIKLEEYNEFSKRKKYIIESLQKRDLLSDDLNSKIQDAKSLTALEDLYQPYKIKKQSRATIAKNKGLEELAVIIFEQEDIDLDKTAAKFIKISNNKIESVNTIGEAIEGARDIIAEWINDDIDARTQVRNLFEAEAYIYSKVKKTKKEEAEKFTDYFDFSQELSKIPSHRLLAIRRGEKEGFLNVKIEPKLKKGIAILENLFVKNQNECSQQLKIAIVDSYKRLLSESIENEIAKHSKEIADIDAIKVFTANLRQLLLSPPLGQKRIMAIDPGFRTGCKVVILNQQGTFVENTVIYPDQNSIEAKNSIIKLVEKFKIEAIAIGNGTASRETETFVKSVTKGIDIFVVSESGASVYSASQVAREEFPTLDITVRGAISIGRRLLDPLAELVKVDPKAIGVGQYQHDVDQKKLKESLDQTVINCVNLIGVNLNTATKHILTYVSGLGPTLAQNIIAYRNENGAFTSRKELLKVKKLGTKAFEQCAGFLRIENAKNPLDNSAVHPESYFIVEKIAKDIGVSVKDIIGKESLKKDINLNNYVTEKIGILTLQDIILELMKPGVDPRGEVEKFEFADVSDINDLEIGMTLPGIITNITNFGAFVDIGVHCDGLVHISQLSDSYVKNPNDVVTLNQKVMVKVTQIEIERKRIGLSMKV